MNCPYCAETLPDEIVFCPECGTQMGSPLPDTPARVPFLWTRRALFVPASLGLPTVIALLSNNH